MSSSGEYPSSRVAAGLTKVMVPERSTPKMPSDEDSRIRRLRSSLTTTSCSSLLSSRMSRSELQTSMPSPSGSGSGLRPISTGNSPPSLPTAVSVRPTPIARTEGSR